MTPEEVVKKYIDAARIRAENNMPAGEICDYCASNNSRNKDGRCSKCSAEMPYYYGSICGVPVYDHEEFKLAEEWMKI